MIICPHCEFSNPAEHKFCQSCGAPLQPWRALILPGSSSAALLAAASESEPDNGDDTAIWQQVAASEIKPMATAGSKAVGDWLGSRQRYQLVEELMLNADSPKPLAVQVTDTKPNDMVSSLVKQPQQFSQIGRAHV